MVDKTDFLHAKALTRATVLLLVGLFLALPASAPAQRATPPNTAQRFPNVLIITIDTPSCQ